LTARFPAVVCQLIRTRIGRAPLQANATVCYCTENERTPLLRSGKSAATTDVLAVQRVDWLDESAGAFRNTTVGEEPQRREILQQWRHHYPRGIPFVRHAPHLRVHSTRTLLRIRSVPR
jgi:hypothetical protein